MTDINTMWAQLSPSQQRAFLKAKSKASKSQMDNAEYRAKCREKRAELEDDCIEDGLILSDVFTVPAEDQVWRNPANPNETWESWRKGKKPDWAKDDGNLVAADAPAEAAPATKANGKGPKHAAKPVEARL